MSNKQIILRMMREAPGRFVSMGQLAAVYQSHRAGARVWDLKRDGHEIEYVRAPKWNESGYRLVRDAELDAVGSQPSPSVQQPQAQPVALQEIDGQICFV